MPSNLAKDGSLEISRLAAVTAAIDRGAGFYLAAVAEVSWLEDSRTGSLCGAVVPVAGSLDCDVTFAFPKNAARAFSNESCFISVVSLIWSC